VRRALAEEVVTSTQVLAEYAATLPHKISPAAPPEDVAALLDALDPIGVVVPDGDLVRRAVEARGAYGIHFYDGLSPLRRRQRYKPVPHPANRE